MMDAMERGNVTLLLAKKNQKEIYHKAKALQINQNSTKRSFPNFLRDDKH